MAQTLLIPLWARATETLRDDSITTDPLSVRLLDKLGADTTRFSGAWKSQLAMAIRSERFDRITEDFLKRNPKGTVLNLGAGLDTRFFRLCEEQGPASEKEGSKGKKKRKIKKWVDVDLPEVIELRQRLLPAPGPCLYLPYDVRERGWLEELLAARATGYVVEVENPVLVVAEGLLMYLKKAQVRDLFQAISERFPRGEAILDVIGEEMAAHTDRHDSVSKTEGRFLWGCDDVREMESWDVGLKIRESWSVLDFYPERWGSLRRLRRRENFRQQSTIAWFNLNR